MKEFILSREEMLALMVAVNTSLIVGVDNDRLVPDSQEMQRTLTLQGLDSLRARGLLTKGDDGETELLDGDLGMMAGAIAFPRVLTFIARDVPGQGRQQFLHYRLDPVNVELTMPTEKQYRLAALQDAVTSLARIREILPVTARGEDGEETAVFTMSEESFLRAKELAEQGERGTAVARFLEAGAAADAAAAFTAVLQQPTLGGTITFMQLEAQQIIDARDLAMVKDENGGWIIRQAQPGQPELEIRTVTAVDYSQILLNMLDDLLTTEPGE